MADSTFLADLRRRSQDLIRVYNPLDEDYIVTWDKSSPIGAQQFRVEAKSEEVLIRYIAEKYVKEMTDKIIIEEADKKVREENERRIQRGMKKMDPWDEQPAFETQLLSPDSDRYKEIIATLWVGVEREHGMDRRQEQPDQEAQVDSKPKFEKALEEVQKNPEYEVRKKEEKPEPKTKKYTCDYPGCDFSTDTQIALSGHKRSHKSKVEKATEEISEN